MAAHGALAEDDHAAGEDVGALDRDRHRDGTIRDGEVVVRTLADTTPAVNIHGIVDHGAKALAVVMLEHRRDDAGLFAGVERGQRQQPRRVHHVGIAADARQRLLDALEAPDGQMELVPHPGIGAGQARAELAAARPERRQRDAAPGRQAFHEHGPAVAQALAPADDPIQRDEDVRAAVGPVHEGRAERVVALADGDAGRGRGDERAGDAEIRLAAEQPVRVVRAEGEPQHRGHRPQGDVALFPVGAQAEYGFAVVLAPADHARVRDRGRIRAGVRARERETRDLAAIGQARQVVLLLPLGAVGEQ